MPRLILLVALTMVAFAANSVLNRMALTGTETGPAAFAALRLASGAAILVGLTLANGGAARLTGALCWQNAVALAVYMLGFSFAYVWLDAGLGALILFGGVQLTMFAGAVIGGEAIPRRRWAGAGVAFAGLVVLLWPGGAGAPALAGTGLMAAAALGWGLFSLMGRGNSDPLAVTAGAFALASLPGLLVVLLMRDGLSPGGAALAVLSGAVTSGLGYALWYSLLPMLTASVAAVAQLTVPVIAVAGGALVLGEGVGLRFAVAAALVLGGILLALPRRAAPVAPAGAS